MAITAPQRQAAIGEILAAFTNPSRLNLLLPGLTASAVVTTIASAIGANLDTQLTTVLANMVTEKTAQLSGLNATTTVVQADITAWTVV